MRDGPEDMDETAVRAFLRKKVGQEKENHYFSVIKYVVSQSLNSGCKAALEIQESLYIMRTRKC